MTDLLARVPTPVFHAVSSVAHVLLGSLSGLLSNSGDKNDWFRTLRRPSIQPPSIVFPIVWTLLYAIMGVSISRAVILGERNAKNAGNAARRAKNAKNSEDEQEDEALALSYDGASVPGSHTPLIGPRALYAIYFGQLVMNLAWTPVFFGAHAMRTALALILLILAATVTVAIGFYRQIDRPAGLLLLPYAAWLSFATVLNVEWIRANPTS